MSPHNSSDDDCGEYDSVEKSFPPKNVASGDYDGKPGRLQRGVLRTNCIDCLDRTNVAQYAYGWAALGQQLHALGIRDAPTIELDDPLSSSLMVLYERMGDTLAYQYGGSAVHNKVNLFSPCPIPDRASDSFFHFNCLKLPLCSLLFGYALSILIISGVHNRSSVRGEASGEQQPSHKSS